jgi:hypothetical protein
MARWRRSTVFRGSNLDTILRSYRDLPCHSNRGFPSGKEWVGVGCRIGLFGVVRGSGFVEIVDIPVEGKLAPRNMMVAGLIVERRGPFLSSQNGKG